MASRKRSTVSAWARSRWKRSLDIGTVVVVTPVAVPVVAASALVAAVRFATWPFFVQERIGLEGSPIRVVKIRSLPAGFPPDLGKHELDERRLSRFSRLMRHSHLDEVPQLLSVLTGQMTLVGPRPMIRGVIDLLDDDVKCSRHLVRPGLTGVWQISTMGGLPLHECPELDVAYVEHASFASDVRILWWTVRGACFDRPLTPSDLLLRLRS